MKEKAFKSYPTVEVESSTSSYGRKEPSKDDADASGIVRPPSQKNAKRATNNIVTSLLTGALDRASF